MIAARIVVHGSIGLVTGLVVASCNPAFRDCPVIPAARLAELPDRLSATGLFADAGSDTLAPGVRPFTPRFTSWTDGATKRRWIYLPPGSQIDTHDPDAWNFPVGTKLWKELSRDGVRVETRLLLKHDVEPGDWTPMAYVWTGAGDAIATPDGLVDARGTPHDVPSASTCAGCHGGTPSGVLGFTAIQLPQHGASGELDLEGLVAEQLVTANPGANDLPGDATTQAALGYLHANCSHCHNPIRPPRTGARCFDPEKSFSFLLRAGELDSVASTATYRTAIGEVIDAGDPGSSEIMDRMRSRSSLFGMPALGTEQVDDQGVALIRSWITALPH